MCRMLYVVRQMTCDEYYKSHEPLEDREDHCKVGEIESSAAAAISSLGLVTTIFGEPPSSPQRSRRPLTLSRRQPLLCKVDDRQIWLQVGLGTTSYLAGAPAFRPDRSG